MKETILVVGEGVLSHYVTNKLIERYEIIRQIDFQKGIPKDIDFALVLHDTWYPSLHKQAEEIFRTAKIAWMRGFISFGEGIIGPLVRPLSIGCSQCADVRHLMAGRDRKEMWAIQQKLQENVGKVQDVNASHLGLWHMAALLCSEVEQILQEDSIQMDYHVILIQLKTLNTSRHSFLPDPICQVCSQLPDDSARLAQISLQPSPKLSPDSYRTRSLKELSNFLTSDYLDQRMGFLNNKITDLVPPFADVSVNLPLFVGDEGAAGRTNNYHISELTAILEGLERYCGLEPRGKRTMIYDSYNNLKNDALNPILVGVHSDEQYKQPNFPFQKFDPDRPIKWVWGYSLLQDRAMLVPEILAYYSLGCGDGFVYETSNGCALGGSLEEAIFYGIMEVIERDSFLLTWYSKMALPRLDPYSCDDEEIKLMMDRVKAAAGYEIYLYNATMEHGIPSVWAMAKNTKSDGLNLICAAGAHLDPIRAVKSAVHELAGMMLTLDGKFAENRANIEKMFEDSSLVKQMDDHGMLFGLPKTEERLHFLLDSNRPLRTFSEEFTRRPFHKDLTDDLKAVLQALQQLHLEVIVVNQTTPELQKNHLHCVKVLIPGMLPMTFGHHLTRITGLERVLKVPMQLGYTKTPLQYEQLNHHPHPFP